MSSLAARNQHYANTEAAIISSIHGDSAPHAVVSFLPIDRETLETLLQQDEESRLPFTDHPKIDISYHNLNKSDLRGFSFASFDVTGCSFEGALLDRVSLESLLPAARKGKISLRKVNLKGANLDAALVNRKDLGLVSFMPVNMRGVDLAGAIFSSANLKRAVLTGANLKGADFSGANLSLVEAKEANFQHVAFNAATLMGGDFRGSDFRGAIFTGARI